MKKIELYKCEICGTQYKDKETCKSCEQSHIEESRLVNRIVGVRYLPITVDASGMPITITLVGSDGKHYRYKR